MIKTDPREVGLLHNGNNTKTLRRERTWYTGGSMTSSVAGV